MLDVPDPRCGQTAQQSMIDFSQLSDEELDVLYGILQKQEFIETR